jgi:glycosyltransferase involved in cell wall biosynthesis
MVGFKMAPAQAKLFVIFATHNGTSVLTDVLEGYAKAQAPEREWAMIAVDNASTDDTAGILRSFQDRLPLTVLHEPVPSKNRALNRALDYVGPEADLYILTDDDAIPEPDFLRRWEQVLVERPDNELFGGVVRPYFREPPPAWLKRFVRQFPELYAQTERPPGEIRPQDIYGPNMAVRGSVFVRGKRFNEDIGPNSSQADYPMGSENEFCIRVSEDSLTKPWFTDGPKVRHIVRPHQTTFDFIGRRAYRHGRGVAMRQALAIAGGRLPALSLKSRLLQIARSLVARLPVGDSWWQYNWRRGYVSWVVDTQRQK